MPAADLDAGHPILVRSKRQLAVQSHHLVKAMASASGASFRSHVSGNGVLTHVWLAFCGFDPMPQGSADARRHLRAASQPGGSG